MSTVARSTSPARTTQHRRLIVHVVLILSFLVALDTLLGPRHLVWHMVIGGAFALAVLIHLAQRRHRVSALAHQLFTRRARRARRLAWTDAIVTFIFVNLIASGVIDNFSSTGGVMLHLGVIPAIRWHAVSAMALLIFLIVHVARRARRLSSSTVR